MEPIRQIHPDRDPSLGTSIKELTNSFTHLLQSQMQLFKAEMQTTAQRAGRHAAQGAIFGVLASTAVLPFLAFMVIGLGNLLGGLYWLSSLLVALLIVGICAPLALRAFKKLSEEDYTMPRTQETIQEDKVLATQGVHEIKNHVHIDKPTLERRVA